MFYRKDVVLGAVAGLLASSGYAMADGLTLDPTRITAQEETTRAPLMALLGKAGMDKPLDDAKINIYGWIESGYTYNHRSGSNKTNNAANFFGGFPPSTIQPGPFNHEFGDHYMLNQVVLRFERAVATDKFDVGGLIELMYGSDAARIHSTGLGYNGSDATDDGNPSDPAAVANVHPIWQFDIPQAYVTVNLPVGNGLQISVGKWVALVGYETIDPRNNPFYSHSWAFGAMPATHTGVLASYQINDQLSMKFGVTRGWDIALEDTNGCAIDVTGQFAYQINKQMNFMVNYIVGPENAGDTSHYRTAINPIFAWQATDALKLAVEGYYVYDGGLNAEESGFSHAYGDVWGVTVFASYTINDMFTINGRFEKYHSYSDGLGALGDASDYVPGFVDNGNVPTINVYSTTLGVTIHPMPKDPWLKNIVVRPEIRYDFSEDKIFPAQGRSFKDQLTFGADVIVTF